MFNSFEQCPTYFSRGVKFSGKAKNPALPLDYGPGVATCVAPLPTWSRRGFTILWSVVV